MKNQELLITLLYIAGGGQIFVALVYEWVRRILGWDKDIAKMEHRWNQQITHTYSRYIQGINFAFGLITLLFARAFFEGNAIATALALLMTIYWTGRVLVALGYYDTSDITKKRPLYHFGAWGFNALFAYLAAVYGTLFAMTVG